MHQRMCAQCHLSLTDQTDLKKLSLSGINLVDSTYVGLRESVEFGNIFQKNINIWLRRIGATSYESTIQSYEASSAQDKYSIVA